MLGGVAPIILFNFFKTSSDIEKLGIPIIGDFISQPLPPIPIILDERLTGIYIESENKNVDITTDSDSTTTGDKVATNQKVLGSVVTINMLANSDSIGMFLLSSCIDTIYPLVTSKEYSITYLHAGINIFNGLLHSFSINQDSNSTLYNISIQLMRDINRTRPGVPDTKIPVVADKTVVDLKTGVIPK